MAGGGRRLIARAGWMAATVVGVAFVLWLVLIAPRQLVPAISDTALREIPSEARWQARDNRLKLQNDARTTLLQGLGGLAVLVGAFFTVRQVQTNLRQLEVAQQGQVTDRFTRAIDQLGHSVLDVRLGGIYALERIYKDSPQDRAVIAEILTGFVRGHAPWPPSCPGQYVEHAPIEAVPLLQVWALDVQAALTVLAQLNVSRPTLDLKNTDLRRANLVGANLARADFTGARLECADLTGARLQNADLSGANLQGAVLHEAQLQGARCESALLQNADLTEAHLHEARLHGAQLSGSDFYLAKLQHANLSGTDLQRANLQGAEMQNVDLRNAQLQGADLGGAQLQSADFDGAQVEGAEFPGADLNGAFLGGISLEKANLEGAKLVAANLREANLKEARVARADLREANLEGTQLLGALASVETAWPEGFDWRAAGVIGPPRT